VDLEQAHNRRDAPGHGREPTVYRLTKIFSGATAPQVLAAMKLFGLKVRNPRVSVPMPLILYAALGILDFGLTLIAFQLGFKEGNPILDWYAQNNLFEVAKVGSTLAVVFIGFLLWELRIVRGVLVAANVLMVGVVGFHLANLLALIVA
jgi:hypothetical protein